MKFPKIEKLDLRIKIKIVEQNSIGKVGKEIIERWKRRQEGIQIQYSSWWWW